MQSYREEFKLPGFVTNTTSTIAKGTTSAARTVQNSTFGAFGKFVNFLKNLGAWIKWFFSCVCCCCLCCCCLSLGLPQMVLSGVSGLTKKAAQVSTNLSNNIA